MCYTLGQGMAHGLGYIMPIHYNWEWWTQRPGLVSGIIIGGFGLGTVIFDPISTALVNPDNVKRNDDGLFPSTVADNVPSMLRKIAIINLGLVLVATIMIFKRKIPKTDSREPSS